MRDLQWAMEEFNTYESLNLPPHSGGQNDQEAEWVEGVKCISDAYGAAKAWAERKENEEAQSRAKRK